METANPVLVEVWRGNVLESFHRGLVCIVGESGQILYSAGDTSRVIYPRSALKPFQVLPLIELGGVEKFGFTLEEIAIMCGSHNGEQRHLEVVASVLNKVGMPEEAFQCGAHYPWLEPDVSALYVMKQKPRQIHNNCSGKHAGFLALCKLIDAPVETYLHPENPAQQLVRKAIADMFEYPEDKLVLGVDGCSAPVYAMPAYNMALAYKNLAAPRAFSTARQAACKVVVEAMAKHPFMVAGNTRYDTVMMEHCGHEVVGKVGAEGIFGLSFYNTKKLGVCIKIDDGKMQPQYAVAQKVVNASGLFAEKQLEPLQQFVKDDVTNHAKKVTGYFTVIKDFIENLVL